MNTGTAVPGSFAPDQKPDRAAGPRGLVGIDLDRAAALEPGVLVLNFDPIIRAEGGKRLHEVLGWQDPRGLADEFIAHLADCSGGYVNYKIANWLDVDAWPAKTDGFRYDEETFLQNWRSRSSWHQPDAIDYEAILADYDLLNRVEKGQIDEVWLFGFPYSGFYESVMVGRDAFWCNSPPIPRRDISRRFVIMGFSYERGIGAMLESYGHRTESILKQLYTSWQATKTTPWDRFIQYDKQSPGQAGCGWMHYAPNSVTDYDWGNRELVWSTCDDWLNYPNLTGQRRQVNCEEWGNGDMLAHHLWWFRHLPHAPGRSQGMLNNWWAYAVTLRVEDTAVPDLRVTPETLPRDVPRLLDLLGQNTASRGAARLLRSRQEQEKAQMRRAIAGLLGELGDDQAVDPLVALLQDRDADVRLAAALALGQIGDARAVDALDKTAGADADARVREAATAALVQIDPMPRVGRVFASQYQILQEMEQGGLTVTYRARDIRLEREVVLKVVKEPPATPTFLPAFEREADTFARLQHPSLVRVLGYSADAIRPFYDREPVGDESSLRDLLARRSPLSLAETVALVNQVAAALDYLHRQTPPLIHQHVKPAHILLAGEPDSPAAVLTDALATRAFTAAGLQAGTPAYTSPEQAEGRLDRISPQTDVYALGVTAYEMLTGHTPFVESETPDLLRAHSQEPPPSPQRFVPGLSDPVSAVLLKALAKSSEERYPSAGAFAAALLKAAIAFWLVTANPEQYDWNVAFDKGSEQWTGVLGAEAQQNLRQARPGDVVLAYRSSPDRYVAGLGHIASQPYEYQDRYVVQIDMDHKLEAGVSLDELKQATPDLQHVTRPRPLSFSPVTAEQWAVIRELIQFHNPDLPLDSLPPITVSQRHGLAIESVDMPAECKAGQPIQVTLHLRNRGNLTWQIDEQLHIAGHWWPEGRGGEPPVRTWNRVPTIGQPVPPGGALELPDIEGGQAEDEALTEAGRYEVHWTVWGLAWEPAGDALPTAIVPADVLAPAPYVKILDRISPSAENDLLWAEGLRQKLSAPELYTEHLLAGLYQEDKSPARLLLTLFDDEATINASLENLVSGPSGGVSLADVQPAPPEALRRLPLSANANRALAQAATLADEKSSTRISALHLLAGLLAAPESIAAPWIAEQLQVERETLYHLIAAAPEQEPPLLAIWWASTRRVTVLAGHSGAVTSLAFALEGTLLTSSGEDATLRTWNLLRGTALGSPMHFNSPVRRVIVTPDDARRILALADGSLTEISLDGDSTTVIPTVGGDVVQMAEGAAPPALALSPDGLWLATAWPGGALSARNLSTGQQMDIVRSLPGPVAALAVGPGANYLATASAGPAVSVWSSSGGVEMFQLVSHEGQVNALVFTPDGTRLVSASDDRTLRVWDLQSGRERFTLRGHDGPVRAIVVTLDGRWAVSGADDTTLKVWDLATGRDLITLRGHGAAVTALALSPDGRGLASGDHAGMIRLWDLAAVAAELPQPMSLEEALARIELVMGDLLDMPVDALVNPSSPTLGLDGIIGRQLVERIGKDLLSRLSDQPTVPLGTAFSTDAHPLAARYLIHTPVREAPYATLETVVTGAQAALSKADSLGDIHAVAFPSLGSGAAGLSPASVAPGVLKAVVSHLEQGSRLDRILFTFVEADAYRAYAAAYHALGGILPPPEWLVRLSTSSRRALRLAEALRQQLGAGLLTTAHLLWGFYQIEDGATQRLLTTFDSHEQIASSLANWLQAPGDIASLQPMPESALGDILLDADGQRAMEEAARLPTHDNIIPERHLLAGLLAVSQSGAAQWIASTLGLTTAQLEWVAGEWQGQEGPALLPDLVRRARRTYALLLGARPKESTVDQAAEFAVGQSLFLHVELLPGLPGSPDAFELPPDITELYCFLAEASGLHIAGSSVVALPLALLGRQLPRASFALQARLPGPRSYVVELFGEHPDQGGRALAQAGGQLSVVAPQAGQAIEPLQPILDLRVAAKPDLVLLVETALPEGDTGPRQLTYRLTCRLPGLRRNNEEVGQVTLRPADLAYLRSLVHRTVAATTGLQPEDVRARMHSLGRYLFDRLFPAGEAAAFREALWQAQAFWASHERPGQLPPTWLIVQEEATWLPWELVTPYRLENDGPVAPLAELYCLGRWVEGLGQTLYGEVPLGDKVLTHYKVLTPDQARQDEELQAWQRVLDVRATADSFLPVLKPETNFYGLHLLRHANQVGRTREIMVRAGALRRTSAEDEAQRGRLDLHQRRPVVTLSILDGQEPEAAGDDWLLPERVLPFLRAGASAVLGPWWPTSEAADQEFWARFYGYLAGRLPLGEAAWRARYAVQRKFPDRPDWLAYTLLGDPRARPYVPEKSEGYTALECLNAEADGSLHPGKTYTFRASIQRRPPVWYQNRIVETEPLPEQARVRFLPLGLREPYEVEMTSDEERTLLQATTELTPQATGDSLLMVQLFAGSDLLTTLQLTLEVRNA